MKMGKKDEHKITAVLIGGMIAFFAMYGLMSVIGSYGVISLGLAVLGLMVFFLICVPLIDRLIVLLGMKIIERQNKKEQS